MYSFYEIKEMEKAKGRDILKAKNSYSKKRRNSEPGSEAVQERKGIIHYPDHPIITKIAGYGYFSLFRLPRSGMPKTIQRFALLTKVFFDRGLLFQNKAFFSGRRS